MGDYMAKEKELFSEENSQGKSIEEYGILNYHVLESMADWVRVVNKQGVILYANQIMKDALGDDIIGLNCNTVHERDSRCNFCFAQRSIATGEVVQKEEKFQNRYYSVKSSPVTNINGDIFAAVQVFRDVTRERQLEYELIGRNKKMHRDLQFAKRIQGKILPKRGSIGDLHLDYIYRPSEMLSGDMFDIFHIDNDNIGFYISDVAGHGVAASMMTMFIRQTMRVIKDDIVSPSIALAELHRRFVLLELEPEYYFTMFYGVYNRETRKFKYANAGHSCIPIRYNEDEMDLLKVKGCPIVRIFEENLYDEKNITVKKGDKILLYTDGITEGRDYDGKEFGEKGVVNAIKKSPDNILIELEKQIEGHSWGEQEDDFTVLLVEVMR